MLQFLHKRSRESRAQTFERLVRPHVPALYRSAHRFTGSAADAEDLVQNVLVKVYRHATRLEDIDDLRPWLLRVLYRTFVDARRSEKRRTLRERESVRAAIDSGDDLAPVRDEPVAALEQRQLANHVGDVLRRLTDEQRALVTLHFVDGYTLEQLAEVFDAPVGTLKSRIYRIRAQLRALVAMEPFPNGERV
jgi:RNA polymerase sigma factor (sigma-70 family)